jgi:hypothetical protein
MKFRTSEDSRVSAAPETRQGSMILIMVVDCGGLRRACARLARQPKFDFDLRLGELSPSLSWLPGRPAMAGDGQRS